MGALSVGCFASRRLWHDDSSCLKQSTRMNRTVQAYYAARCKRTDRKEYVKRTKHEQSERPRGTDLSATWYDGPVDTESTRYRGLAITSPLFLLILSVITFYDSFY